MASHEYKCNGCGAIKPRDELVVKKAVFASMGEGASTIKSRVTAWLCEPCVTSDPDWRREKNLMPAERVPASIKELNNAP